MNLGDWLESSWVELSIGAAYTIAGIAVFSETFDGVKGEHWAAWAQAVGSVVAIFVAIRIASRQSRDAARERHEERCSDKLGQTEMALSHVLAVSDLGVTLAHALENAYYTGSYGDLQRDRLSSYRDIISDVLRQQQGHVEVGVLYNVHAALVRLLHAIDFCLEPNSVFKGHSRLLLAATTCKDDFELAIARINEQLVARSAAFSAAIPRWPVH